MLSCDTRDACRHGQHLAPSFSRGAAISQQVRAVVARSKGAPAGLPLLDVFGRGGALKSSWYGDCLPSRDLPMLIDLSLRGRLDLDALVTETIAPDEVEKAFEGIRHGDVLRSVVLL